MKSTQGKGAFHFLIVRSARMNGAVVGNSGGQWLVRGAKAAIFDLPNPNMEIEIDLSDVERTAKRPALSARKRDDDLCETRELEELDEADILVELPADSTEPFHLVVPDKLHARAAELTAQLRGERERETVPPAAPARGSRWMVPAFVVGACAVLGFAVAFVAYNAPIPSSQAHTFKAARPALKVVARHVSALAGVMVPTVHVDSLPRARR